MLCILYLPTSILLYFYVTHLHELKRKYFTYVHNINVNAISQITMIPRPEVIYSVQQDIIASSPRKMSMDSNNNRKQ